MGRTKALLPLPGGGCFLQRIERTFHAAGAEPIVAVLGRDAPAIRTVLGTDRSLVLRENHDAARGQLSSLLLGLDALDAAVPAVLVTTVDLPLVSLDTVARVLGAWRRSGAAIVRPAQGSRHGHPVVFSASLFGELRDSDPREGARAVLRAHAGQILDVPVDDPGAFDDIDTPEDYERFVGLPFPAR